MFKFFLIYFDKIFVAIVIEQPIDAIIGTTIIPTPIIEKVIDVDVVDTILLNLEFELYC